MSRTHTVLAAAVLALQACGGGGDGDGDPLGPGLVNGTFTASVDGSAFTAGTLVTAAYNGSTLAISAAQGSQLNVKTFGFGVANVTGEATYSLTLAGNFGTYAETVGGSASSWLCNIVQGSGQIVITQLTATKVVGSFSMTVVALAPATGTKTITGNFNITITNPE